MHTKLVNFAISILDLQRMRHLLEGARVVQRRDGIVGGGLGGVGEEGAAAVGASDLVADDGELVDLAERLKDRPQ